MPIVFDNLVHKKEMPVTIGVFINPGHISSELPENPFRPVTEALSMIA
jgi:enterochelin esterase family protein